MAILSREKKLFCMKLMINSMVTRTLDVSMTSRNRHRFIAIRFFIK